MNKQDQSTGSVTADSPPATGSVLSESLRREAQANELCGSADWSDLLHQAANAARAAEDFVWNVEHSNIAGIKEALEDVRADRSFRALKAAVQAQNDQALPQGGAKKGNDEQ